MPELLRLDRRVPFIDAVFRVIDGGEPLQTAVDALARAEADAGVVIVGNPITTWIDGVMALPPDAPTPSLPELVRLCVGSNPPADTPFVAAPMGLDGFYGEAVDRLLDRTHLLVTGGDLCNDYGFVVDQRTIGSAGTWRSWAEIVASWANRRGLVRPSGIGRTKHARAQRPWGDGDFYMRHHVADLVEDYDRWIETVLAVLAAKNRELAVAAGIAIG